MYDYIKGILTKITATAVVIETGGIGYSIIVANPYRFSEKVQQSVQLYLHHVVREDAHLLFGFYSEDEKSVFRHLISVSGIGPMTALAILAVNDNEGLVRAIENNDINYLIKFPKIGKKTAQQMILDLSGKFIEVSQGDEPAPVKNSQANEPLDEAMEALLALGYKANELKKIKKSFDNTDETTEVYIKQSLKMLMK